MKQQNLLLKILGGIMIASLCFNAYQCSDNRDYQKELADKRKEIKANDKERTELKKSLKYTQDSLEIAFNTIRSAKDETAIARQEKLLEKAKYEKILFNRYATDSARNSAIADLYHSYGNP